MNMTIMEAGRQPATPRAEVASLLQWLPDRLLLNDLVFRIQQAIHDDWEHGEECFCFYKDKGLVDEYVEFWAARESVSVRNLMELGIWDGGSSAFWFEFFQPDKHIALDWGQKQDSDYFTRYVLSRSLQNRLKTFWGVDQEDQPRLSAIVDAEFEAPLDLVIDDASHLYGPSRASFETLFPRLRPGGLYIIEDWAWDHWTEFHRPDSPFAGERRLTDLVCEVTEAIGTRADVIKSMTVCHGFVAIKRGHAVIDSECFNLDAQILRRPGP